MLNPHFDQNRIVWRDEYSGQYEPPVYDDQFELQWKLALGGNEEYFNNPGTSTDSRYIDDRVYEWTGKHPTSENGFYDPTMGSRVLDYPLDTDLIEGKRCVDIGCGMGRWTRTMQRVGAAEVLSIDISESAIESTRRFNDHIMKTDILKLPEQHPELREQFDFANLWGVAMCTHDPKTAFESAAFTVRPGGAIYLMVYAPDGSHNLPLTNVKRRKFHSLKGVEERLAFVDSVHARRWDADFPLIDNCKNVLRSLLGRHKGHKTGVLDMLEPFYNWVIPMGIIEEWMAGNGFGKVTVLNPHDKHNAAHHVLGQKVPA